MLATSPPRYANSGAPTPLASGPRRTVDTVVRETGRRSEGKDGSTAFNVGHRSHLALPKRFPRPLRHLVLSSPSRNHEIPFIHAETSPSPVFQTRCTRCCPIFPTTEQMPSPSLTVLMTNWGHFRLIDGTGFLGPVVRSLSGGLEWVVFIRADWYDANKRLQCLIFLRWCVMTRSYVVNRYLYSRKVRL